MAGLPDDPFDDPVHSADAGVRAIREAAVLTAAFADFDSLAGVVEALEKADRQDLELVAMLAVASRVQGVLDEEDFCRWLSDPATAEPLG